MDQFGKLLIDGLECWVKAVIGVDQVSSAPDPGEGGSDELVLTHAGDIQSEVVASILTVGLYGGSGGVPAP